MQEEKRLKRGADCASLRCAENDEDTLEMLAKELRNRFGNCNILVEELEGATGIKILLT